MYCRYCGACLSGDARYCKSCGKAVRIDNVSRDSDNQEMLTNQSNNESNSVYTEEEESIWKRFSWIPQLVAPLLVFALFFGLLDKPLSNLIRFLLGGQ